MDREKEEFEIPQGNVGEEENLTQEVQGNEENSGSEQYGIHPDHFQDVKTLLSWSAPGRPFKHRSRQYYLSMILIVFFFEVVLFLFSQYAGMVVVLSLAFLAVALSQTPPRDFHYKITTEGIKVEDHFYIWTELYDFYFKHIDGSEMLIIRTEAFLPGELQISLGDITREHARKVLVNFISYREFVKPTFMEKAGEWLAHNFPLEGAK